MPERVATARRNGPLADGNGTIRVGTRSRRS